VDDVSALENCVMLEHLSLIDCKPFGVMNLEKNTRLTELSLIECDELRLLSGLPASLCLLHLEDCGPDDLSCLSTSALPHLDTLLLKLCTQISDCAEFRTCTALRVLDLSGTRVHNIGPLAVTCPQLRWLSLSGCRELRDVSPLAACLRLEHLDLSRCPKLQLSVLPVSLKSICLAGTSLDLSALTNCENLHTLDLTHSSSLSDISPLGCAPVCNSLHTITLDGCVTLTCLKALVNCTSLKILSLIECEQIRDISPLGSCTGLQRLNLRMIAFGNLQDVAILALCKDLRFLDLNAVHQVRDVSILRQACKYLYIFSCFSLHVCFGSAA
jgi:Leucine-rich repeat (LRR) protein